MFKRTLRNTKALDLTIGQHDVRVSIRREGKFGVFGPNALLSLTGPNGSPAGRGPKAWPLFNRLYLTVPLPQFSWATAYKLRRLGGLRAYNLQYRLYTRALS